MSLRNRRRMAARRVSFRRVGPMDPVLGAELWVIDLNDRMTALKQRNARRYDSWSAEWGELSKYYEDTAAIDRSTWGPGEWDGEPDYASWVDEATGYRCLARRVRHHGTWCGYVGVPPGHPAHAIKYDDIDARVHGGLTFGAQDTIDGWWWFGFDCAHYRDYMPGLIATMKSLPSYAGDDTDDAVIEALVEGTTYRTLEYVRHGINNLVRYLREME